MPSTLSETPTPDQLRAQFLEAMSQTATSVSIVATDGEAGRFGLTVSAVTSVTADPPTLLVCIHRRNPIEAALRSNGRFAVSMLRADQRAEALTFAGRPLAGQPYDFGAAHWLTTPLGNPQLAGAVAWFDCHLIVAHHVGTHAIFIGRVADCGANPGLPLVYGRRSFAEILQLPGEDGALAAMPEPVWDEPPGPTLR